MQGKRKKPRRISIVVFALFFIMEPGVWLSPDTAYAQYFGRNKVQYKTFRFHILYSEHFAVYFYPEERETAIHATQMAERWYSRYTRIFDHELEDRQPLILYASQPDFQQTNAVSDALGEGTGGVTEALKGRIILPVGRTLKETDHVIGHELVHAFQYDLTRNESRTEFGFVQPVALRLPLWFIEGMAEYLTLGPVDPHTAMWMRDASLQTLPTLDRLEDPRYFPYRYGQALIAYIAGRWGDAVLGKLLKNVGKSADLNQTIRTVCGQAPDSLVQDWHRAIHETYDPLVPQTAWASDYGRVLIHDTDGVINAAPALSPDGRQLIFMSSRSLFSIDFFLADAATGKIKRKLTSTALDPHFESLQFIHSAGAWDAQGQRFVFAAISEGRPLLSILNVERNEMEREISFFGRDEIFNPSWSPDGRHIVFSALTDGSADLFIYDLDTDSLRQVTDDAFSDIQPAWSPDGRSIAFVTERFSTTLSNMDIGEYRLAMLDPETGSVQAVPAFTRGKHINPQWSPDSRHLFFVSDHTGISNLYRLRLDSGAIEQWTNVFTGISGITAISPSFSVATQTGQLAFSAYEEGNYRLYMIPDPDKKGHGLPLQGRSTDDILNAARLPPVQRVSGDLEAMLRDPETELPDRHEFSFKPYSPVFSLDYVGQPYVAAGVDRFGSYIGGGGALFWSDMLGDHNLVTALQVNGTFRDIAVLAGYQNTKRRWDWGVIAQQTPYVSGGFASAIGNIGGEPTLIEQQLTERQVNRTMTGLLQYPFNRARRVEFFSGYVHVAFDRKEEIRAYSLNTGQEILRRRNDLPTPDALHFFQFGAALVYDQTVFGVTSPVLGRRYRFEVAPTLGTLRYTDVLADYRRYVMPLRPYTLAIRALHFGRYGQNSESNRLSSLFIGYPGLVRGYDFYSFDFNGDILDRLSGTRLAVANFELRAPLYHLLTFGRGDFYGFLPVEVAPFFDTGVAWTSQEKAFFLGGSRKLIKSAGIALRLNVGGLFVFELDYVHPYDRPYKGWLWQFNFTPGF